MQRLAEQGQVVVKEQLIGQIVAIHFVRRQFELATAARIMVIVVRLKVYKRMNERK